MPTSEDYSAPTRQIARPATTTITPRAQNIYIVYAKHKTRDWLGFLLFERRGSRQWTLLSVEDTNFDAAEMNADNVLDALGSQAARQALADGHELSVKRFDALNASDPGTVVYAIGG